jgi:hypothetical protein
MMCEQVLLELQDNPKRVFARIEQEHQAELAERDQRIKQLETQLVVSHMSRPNDQAEKATRDKLESEIARLERLLKAHEALFTRAKRSHQHIWQSETKGWSRELLAEPFLQAVYHLVSAFELVGDRLSTSYLMQDAVLLGLRKFECELMERRLATELTELFERHVF